MFSGKTVEITKMNFIRPPPSTEVGSSVTRLGEILPLWQNFKSLWLPYVKAYLVSGKISYLFLQVFIDVNGQRLKI